MIFSAAFGAVVPISGQTFPPMTHLDPGPIPQHTVLLVEDQTAIREMLARFVASIPGFAVVGESGDAQEATRLIGTLRPDVIVLDWLITGGSGADVLRALPASARPHVLVFSANTTGAVVREAFALGACGFFEKTGGFQQFTEALVATAQGRTYLGPAVAKAVSQIVRQPRPDSPLTPREREVLRLVAEGLPSKLIAERLKIRLRTVHTHRASLARKTGLRSIAELTLYACEQGMVQTAPLR